MVLDLLASREGVAWERSGPAALTGSWNPEGQRALLIKPLAYMNRSGEVLGPLMEAYGVRASSLVVVHDDLDLPFGRLKLKRGGGSGGHRGVDSILGEVVDDRFLRVKMGIGRPPPGMGAEDYVLMPFREEEAGDPLAALVGRGADAVACAVREGASRAMNHYNVRRVETE